jgi:hypothetical protein
VEINELPNDNGLPNDVSPSDSRRRRQLAIAVVGGALAALLGFGAVATTFAADPSPSPSAGTEATPAPNRTNQGGGLHRGMKGNCPNMGNGGGGGSGNGSSPANPSSPTPSEAPSDTPES